MSKESARGLSMIRRVTATLGCLAVTTLQSAWALETAPGDYEPLPAGKTALLLYYQHAQSDRFYNNGHELSDNFRLRSDIGLLRAIQSVPLSDTAFFQPQVILPFGHLQAAGDASALGTTTGVGDLIVGLPVIWRSKNQSSHVFAFGPYIYAPTGSYDRGDGLNLGENRWRLVLQGAYIYHFDERWALDTVADVSWFSHNDDYSTAGATLQQKARQEYQAYVRYQWSPATTFGVGGGYVHGGRTQVEGIDQDDEIRTSYVRLTLTHFYAPDLQFQVQAGRDLTVEQGFKEQGRLNLRLLKLF